MLLATASLFEPVARHATRDPLLVPPATTCAAVVERMTELRAPCAYVVDGAGQLVGIVTTGDVARRVTFQTPAEAEVRRVMTCPVQTLRADEPLYRALARLRRGGWRRMPVVDDADRVIGTFAIDGALWDPLAPLEPFVGEDSVAGLARIKAAQAEVAAALLAGAHSVPELQALFSGINLDLHRRVVALALEAMAQDGWGTAPVPFCVVVMGSIGRGESLLNPDQDNGLLLADHATSDRVVVERFFVELARRMTTALAQAGFPLCKGNVMATNAVWRLPLSAWKRQIETWIAQRSADAILNADICFDFRAATGPEELAEAVRTHITAVLADRRFFLRDMCVALMEHKVGLGHFGRLASEHAGDRQHLDLKLRGTLPLVAAVRLLALREGMTETSTLQRLAGLRARGVLGAGEHEALGDAYRNLTYLQLRQQLADSAAGRPVSHLVSSAGWSRARRHRVADDLRTIDTLLRRVREDLTGQVL
jgi:CBS domain-containing protein